MSQDQGAQDGEAKIAKWRREFGELWKRAAWLASVDDKFWQLQAIFKDNPDVRHREPLTHWMGQCYFTTLAVGLRGLVDERSGTLSLVRLLSEIARNCSLLTRTRFVGLYFPQLADHASDVFDRLGGQGHETIPKRVVQKDLEDVKARLKPIKRFVDTRVAHVDRMQLDQELTFGDLREALKTLRQLCRKYSLMLDASTLGRIVPHGQESWVESLRVPWLPEGAPVPEYDHIDADEEGDPFR